MSKTVPCPAKWAQRADTLFLSFQLPDSKNVKVEILNEKMSFTATNDTGDINYENKIEFYKSVKVAADVEKEQAKAKKPTIGPLPISGYQIKGRTIDCLLYKQDRKNTDFWPKLTKDSKKPKWLSVDFNRWRDEDDSEDETENFNKDFDFSKFMNAKGGLNTEDGQANFDPANINMDDIDSDDDSLPDLNQAAKEGQVE